MHTRVLAQLTSLRMGMHVVAVSTSFERNVRHAFLVVESFHHSEAA